MANTRKEVWRDDSIPANHFQGCIKMCFFFNCPGAKSQDEMIGYYTLVRLRSSHTI